MKRIIHSLCDFIISIILLSFIGCSDSDLNLGIQTVYTGNISGTVRYSNLDEFSNNGIIVTLERTGIRTITSDDGSYIFENLEEGVYTVSAQSPYSSEKTVCANVVVRAAETTIAESLNLIATGSITGRITLDNADTGNSGFLVFVAGTSYMAMTDDVGNYKISGIPAGKDYLVIATKNDVFHSLGTNVNVPANAFVEINKNNFTSDELKGKKGDKGDIGEGGKNIVWLGSFDDVSEIREPEYLNAYFNKTDNCSYIWDGTEWKILARTGASGTDCFSALVIETVRSTYELTNKVIITVNVTKDSFLKIGYVYSVEKPDFKSANAVLRSSDFIPITKDSENKYTIEARENGYYTIAAKDTDGFVDYQQEVLTNLDPVVPGNINALQVKYNLNEKVLTATWTNPDDSDLAYVDFSYTKDGTLQIEDEHTKNESYSINNVGIDGVEYEFTLFAVDLAGNTSEVSSVKVAPLSVGDVLLNDGTIILYDADNLFFTDEQKEKVVGVLYGKDENGRPKGWLGKNNSANEELNRRLYDWSPSYATKREFYDIQCVYNDFFDYNDNVYKYTITGDTDGRDNWAYICSVTPISTSGFNAIRKNWPAFSYVNNYATDNGLTNNYSIGWYMPSLAELCMIYRNKDVLNFVLKILGGVMLYDSENSSYWSSSQSDSLTWCIDFSSGSVESSDADSYKYVCCIRYFTEVEEKIEDNGGTFEAYIY